MTQQDRQQHDERVLDYIYGELPPDERLAFEAQLGEDAELRAELESLQKVHGAFQSLPKVSQSPESVQSMTALLMQQAAEQVKASATSAGASANDKPQPEAEAGGGGKILEMRPRGFRRFFQSPATGIFAAAAAALFWVVLKSQPPATTPSSPKSLEPATTVALAPAAHEKIGEGAVPQDVTANFPAAGTPAKPAKIEPPAAPAPVARGNTSDNGTVNGKNEQAPPIKEVFATALSKSAPATHSASPAPEPPIYAARNGMGGKKSAGKGAQGSLLDGDDKAKPEKPMELKPAEKPAAGKLAMLEEAKREKAEEDRANKKAKADSLTGRQFAEAPPPKAADDGRSYGRGESVRAQMEQTQARRKDRIVEQLADQELGAMPAPSGGSARPAAPAPAAPTPATTADEPEAGRYALNQAPAAASPPPPPPAAAPPPAEEPAQVNSQHDYRLQNYASQGPRRSVSTSNSDGDSTGSGLLATVQEQIKQGHCAEANSTLQRIEQAFPATRGLAETRAQWQRVCQTQNQAPNNLQNQNLNLERQGVMAQPSEAPAPSYRSSMPSPAYKMAAPARAKKAAPPPAKSRAADY